MQLTYQAIKLPFEWLRWQKSRNSLFYSLACFCACNALFWHFEPRQPFSKSDSILMLLIGSHVLFKFAERCVCQLNQSVSPHWCCHAQSWTTATCLRGKPKTHRHRPTGIKAYAPIILHVQARTGGNQKHLACRNAALHATTLFFGGKWRTQCDAQTNVLSQHFVMILYLYTTSSKKVYWSLTLGWLGLLQSWIMLILISGGEGFWMEFDSDDCWLLLWLNTAWFTHLKMVNRNGQKMGVISNL